jgi:glycosyltransferase involved in cell wall biosynthesis
LKQNIAIVISGVGKKSGGAERFFAGLPNIYNELSSCIYTLKLITDSNSLRNLRPFLTTGSLSNIYSYRIQNNRFKNIFETLTFLWFIITQRIALVHFAAYGAQDKPMLSFLNKIPKPLRPLIVLNIEDCRLSETYLNPKLDKLIKNNQKYSPIFNHIKLDGIYTWYENLKIWIEKESVLSHPTLVKNASFCFTDVSRFNVDFPKKKTIIFAARFVDIKRPLLFIDIIHYLYSNYKSEVEDWEVLIYGSGELKPKIQNLITSYNLARKITINYADDLSNVLSKTSLFVSTQDIENFTSLSMLEAMAAGNAIVAFNVGQSHYFVKHSENGYLSANGNIELMAKNILKYIKLPAEEKLKFQVKSRQLATEVHTKENFVNELQSFWQEVIRK